MCEVCRVGPGEISSGSREKVKAEARDPYCYWAFRELGYSLTDIAKGLGLSVPGIGYAVRRGEKVAKIKGLEFGSYLARRPRGCRQSAENHWPTVATARSSPKYSVNILK